MLKWLRLKRAMIASTHSSRKVGNNFRTAKTVVNRVLAKYLLCLFNVYIVEFILLSCVYDSK